MTAAIPVYSSAAALERSIPSPMQQILRDLKALVADDTLT